jgi:hypothetical protein
MADSSGVMIRLIVYGERKGKEEGDIGQLELRAPANLPGELRGKNQDAKAKYGDDYARMIKLYFEQIASTRRQASPPAPASGPPSN